MLEGNIETEVTRDEEALRYSGRRNTEVWKEEETLRYGGRKRD